MIKVDLSGAKDFFDVTGPDFAAASAAHRELTDPEGPWTAGNGFISLPENMGRDGLKQIINAAERIRGNSQVLVVIGIGGSYLGPRAAIELLRSPLHNSLDKGAPEIIFAGTGLSPRAMSGLVESVGDRDFSINVISKSGSTLEPAIAFRVFKQLAEKKYGSAARKRIYVTTSATDGLLLRIAESEGYEHFAIPENVGGRYSVLSPVGLLPMAVAGIDIKRMISAAAEAMHSMDLRSAQNPVWQYAASRQHLYSRGKNIELLAGYDPAMRCFFEWWKQLFGESEGKNGIGIFPASLEYSADLHSMGQYVQDGPRTMFETVIDFEDKGGEFTIPFAMGDPDGLNYLAGKDLGSICRQAMNAVKAAHVHGGVPNISITVPAVNEEGFAELVCFFQLSCAISGIMSGVNPFDQPGVESYKSNMFRLLQSM